MGYEMLQFDMIVAAEISDRIKEQHDEANSKIDANRAVARRNQKRSERISQKDMGNFMEQWASGE
jgi:hypothetical protein